MPGWKDSVQKRAEVEEGQYAQESRVLRQTQQKRAGVEAESQVPSERRSVRLLTVTFVLSSRIRCNHEIYSNAGIPLQTLQDSRPSSVYLHAR